MCVQNHEIHKLKYLRGDFCLENHEILCPGKKKILQYVLLHVWKTHQNRRTSSDESYQPKAVHVALSFNIGFLFSKNSHQ